jgi:hypothetical protein
MRLARVYEVQNDGRPGRRLDDCARQLTSLPTSDFRVA